MDKNAIKKYAVWARRELISRVSQRAALYEITDKGFEDASADSVLGRVMSAEEKRQRQALIAQIREKGYEQVMEEIAYTWFNRFIALRFMEVNGYLPSRVRVFTDDENNFKPQILAEAINIELDGLDMEKVYALKNSNDDDALFKYMIIVQCNALSSILPGMFQKISDYTELLFPDNLLRNGSVIEQMITCITEMEWNIQAGGQIEIIGWMYQYYISEKHDEVVDPIYGKEIPKEDVPAATQLFTTDWVVRYIIDNSLGRYWIERKPFSKLANQLDFFVLPSTEIPIHEDNNLIPQNLTVFDPCVGSGHFLTYAFDVLMKIYTEAGYSEREAASEIVSHNLFGIDIDPRAAQLAYFAVMMKGRQFDRRFFGRNVQPHILAVVESNSIDQHCIDYFGSDDIALKSDLRKLVKDFHDAKEYGSIITASRLDYDRLLARATEIMNADAPSLYGLAAVETIEPLIRLGQLLSNRYCIVATNPPYLNKYDGKLKKYITDCFKDYSGDLFSVFMYRNFSYCIPDGYSGMMTPNVWMFIRAYEKMRNYIIENKDIVTLVQMAKGAFFKEATVDICAFVLRNKKTGADGSYIRLEQFKGDMDVQGEKTLEAIRNNDCVYRFESGVSTYKRIPGSPIAYWATEELLTAFESFPAINEIGEAKAGMTTGDNDKFLRSWSEVQFSTIGYHYDNAVSAQNSGCKWFPYNKGGRFRKWYGLNELVVLWANNGEAIKNATKNGRKIASVRSERLYFKESITWATLTSGLFSARYSDPGHLFDDKGSSAFIPKEHIFYVLAFMNSKVSEYILGMLNPTISFQSGNIGALPVDLPSDLEQEITRRVKDCIDLCKYDWDSYECSNDFEMSPLLNGETKIEAAVQKWIQECERRFNKLKELEEYINGTFINSFGLALELTPEVEDKDVSIIIPTAERIIKDFISYAVGCILGRYSLDSGGIQFAGGDWDDQKYMAFKPDRDGIIPICDDEYFDDDIVGQFISFVDAAFGKQYREDNLQYIANLLGGNGSARDTIREYFINEFYKDHLATYAFGSLGKRPIYWLFDSGRKNGFKCLIYMHRYEPDTIARIRTDYVHEQQSRYRTAIADLETRIANAGTGERVKLSKQLAKLQDQAEELRVYEEKIHHLADQMIRIDLDDGVKHNYAIFQDVLAKIK